MMGQFGSLGLAYFLKDYEGGESMKDYLEEPWDPGEQTHANTCYFKLRHNMTTSYDKNVHICNSHELYFLNYVNSNSFMKNMS
jgi:hypothetical protein